MNTVNTPDAGTATTAGTHAPKLLRGPLGKMLALNDFERVAKRHLPKSIFAYVSGVAEEGQAADAINRSFHETRLIPRVLRDVSGRVQATTLFGKTYNHPFGIAPMGSSVLAAFDGDVVLARSAAKRGIPSIVSGASLTRLERVEDEAPGRWFQAYLGADEARVEALVDRVANAGFETLVFTADVAVLGNREHYARAGFETPLRPSWNLAWQGVTHPRWLLGTAAKTLMKHGIPHFENMEAYRGAPILSRNVMRDFGKRDHFSWKHLEIIRRRWKGNLVVKGILAAADARIAADCGVDGIIVSSHGGRQLDGAVAPLHALPGIIDQAGSTTVMLDGGIRRGTDVIKAIALGAQFVFVGRPFLYAAAVFGERGVIHAIDLLSQEVDRNLGMLGLKNIGDVDRSVIA